MNMSLFQCAYICVICFQIIHLFKYMACTSVTFVPVAMIICTQYWLTGFCIVYMYTQPILLEVYVTLTTGGFCIVYKETVYSAIIIGSICERSKDCILIKENHSLYSCVNKWIPPSIIGKNSHDLSRDPFIREFIPLFNVYTMSCGFCEIVYK